MLRRRRHKQNHSPFARDHRHRLDISGSPPRSPSAPPIRASTPYRVLSMAFSYFGDIELGLLTSPERLPRRQRRLCATRRRGLYSSPAAAAPHRLAPSRQQRVRREAGIKAAAGRKCVNHRHAAVLTAVICVSPAASAKRLKVLTDRPPPRHHSERPPAPHPGQTAPGRSARHPWRLAASKRGPPACRHQGRGGR